MKRAKNPLGAMARPDGSDGWRSDGTRLDDAGAEKAKDFKGTLKRLLATCCHKNLLTAVLVAAIISTVFNIVGPKILGLATTKLFEGLVRRRCSIFPALVLTLATSNRS